MLTIAPPSPWAISRRATARLVSITPVRLTDSTRSQNSSGLLVRCPPLRSGVLVFGAEFAADVAGVQDAGCGDAVVESPEVVQRGLRHRFAVGLARDIRADVDGAPALGLDQRDGLRAALVVGQAGGDHRRAFAGEAQAGLAAHPAGAARDERDAILKAARIQSAMAVPPPSATLTRPR